MESIKQDTERVKNSGPYLRQPLPCYDVVDLPEPTPSLVGFRQVLRSRRSADFFCAVSDPDLSSFLYDVAVIQDVDLVDGNRQRRPVASMGGLHPAHVLIYRPAMGWFTYLAESHALGALNVDSASAAAIIGVAREHHPSDTASLLCLLSDCDLAANYYEHYVPLLLRDAGVLLGHASLVAAAHNLAFRILGRTGARALETLVPNLRFKPLASGLALLGQHR